MSKLRAPSEITLRRYGITQQEWLDMVADQDGKCPICKKPIETTEVITKKGEVYVRSYKTNAHIDHRHVPKWKKLPPEERRKHVRGILCQFCNRFYMCKAMTIEKARNIVAYLGGKV